MKSTLLILLVLITISSCKEKWDEEDKRAFFTACTETAIKDWAPNDSVAKVYCDCLFDKMAKKYPEEEDMLAHIDKLAKDTDLIKCKQEILNR